jgi:hypothetical protein
MKSNFTYKINMTMKLKAFHLITAFRFEFMAQLRICKFDLIFDIWKLKF